MNRTSIDIETAKEKSGSYEYVYLRELSRFDMGTTERVFAEKPIEWDKVIEARFFDKNSELRFFRAGEKLKSVLIEDVPFVSEEWIYYPPNSGSDKERKLKAIVWTDENGDKCMDTFPELLHDGAFGKSVTVREYFGYDDDGQIYVTASRLVGWEGKK